MKITEERVTPAIAEKWLNMNTNNRKLKTGLGEHYAHDMKAGNWTQCVDPIVFYEDGSLADGQHRLWAIIMADIPQTFIIVRDLDRNSGLNIDTGKVRDLVDNARISGTADYLSHTLIAVARAVEDGSYVKGQYSNAEKLLLAEKYKDAVQFVIKHGPKGKCLRNAVVLGAVARAYLAGVNPDKLQRFSDVLSSGFCDGYQESAAVALRNYLLDKGTTASSGALWTETFLKVQNAIKYFVASKQLKIIKTVKDEAYPLKMAKLKQPKLKAQTPLLPVTQRGNKRKSLVLVNGGARIR
jgi:hypothetical protein